ncbi:hypothetical protein [Hymenobacter crusticola]|uniref:Uncharacterized protein n=1 Tax=Hymenobacter crusticola TaxID=1770526 RepID=A0A243W967_9BACT|nr:hypothetical protein [Hymenobacter crusticola]OUJ71955.1 hypothetical protein BXP70_20265 [Hymenobacter crusticola]
MRKKLAEWVKRYLPAEVLSLAATLAAGGATFALAHDRTATALAATWAGNVAYFGCILLQDVRATRRSRRAAGKRYTARTLGKNLRALVVEFGAAEVLDSFIIRPLLMYYLPLWLGSLSGGILAAKLAADVTFYIPAIISYELSKKRLRDFN